MSDTLVTSAAFAGMTDSPNLWGPYWDSVSTAVITFLDAGADMSFARTTDNGASWALTEIDAGTTQGSAAWYDRETPGNTGTLVHLTWIDTLTDDVYYRTIDVSDASLGTQRTVDGAITSGTLTTNRIGIAKAVNGTLGICFLTPSELEFLTSTDSGANWTDRADVYEDVGQIDWCLLYPADVDPGDFAAIYWDISANATSIKMFDSSADTGTGTWTETAISGSMNDVNTHRNMDAAVQHSNNHIMLASFNHFNNSTNDLLTWELTVDSIASPTVTARATILTNDATAAGVGIFINQQNNDVYVFYIAGTAVHSLLDCVYVVSTDGMVNFGIAQTYSEDTEDDLRDVHVGRTGGDDGFRIQATFINDDLNDIFVNETNDVVVASAAAAVFTPRVMVY